MKARAGFTVLAIAEDPQIQAALQTEIGQKVGALRFVATSREARQLLRTWRPSMIVWRIQLPSLEDISLAREIKAWGPDSPGVFYVHGVKDVAGVRQKLELLLG
jgi:DNA-binding NtrC family response regulator